MYTCITVCRTNISIIPIFYRWTRTQPSLLTYQLLVARKLYHHLPNRYNDCTGVWNQPRAVESCCFIPLPSEFFASTPWANLVSQCIYLFKRGLLSRFHLYTICLSVYEGITPICAWMCRVHISIAVCGTKIEVWSLYFTDGRSHLCHPTGPEWPADSATPSPAGIYLCMKLISPEQ